MKKQTKQYCQVNIDKEQFRILKTYCDTNSLKMGGWLTNLAIKHIDKQHSLTIENQKGD